MNAVYILYTVCNNNNDPFYIRYVLQTQNVQN